MEQIEIELCKLTEQAFDGGYYLRTFQKRLEETYTNLSFNGEVLNIKNDLFAGYFLVNATNKESGEAMWGKLFSLQIDGEFETFSEIKLGYDFKALTSISANIAPLQGVLNDGSVIKVIYNKDKAQFEAENYGK